MLETRLVLVDDDDDHREGTIFQLEELGFKNFSEFKDGQTAYNYCVKVGRTPEAVQLVISDFRMPKMSGLELLRKVRNNAFMKETPFILITAFAEREAMEDAIKAGVNDVLVKPYTVDALRLKLQSVLAKAALVAKTPDSYP